MCCKMCDRIGPKGTSTRYVYEHEVKFRGGSVKCTAVASVLAVTSGGTGHVIILVVSVEDMLIIAEIIMD